MKCFWPISRMRKLEWMMSRMHPINAQRRPIPIRLLQHAWLCLSQLEYRLWASSQQAGIDGCRSACAPSTWNHRLSRCTQMLLMTHYMYALSHHLKVWCSHRLVSAISRHSTASKTTLFAPTHFLFAWPTSEKTFLKRKRDLKTKMLPCANHCRQLATMWNDEPV